MACPGVRANGMNARIIGAGLTPHPPATTVPPPPTLGLVTEGVDDEFDLCDLAILYRLLWEVGF